MSSVAARPLTGAHQVRVSRDWQTGVNGGPASAAGPETVAEHLRPVIPVSDTGRCSSLNIKLLYQNKKNLSSQPVTNRVFLAEYGQDSTDQALVAQEDAGPRPGQERIWLEGALQRIRPQLLRWTRRSAPSRVEAEEATQRALILLMERLTDGKVALLSEQALKSWLFTVARRELASERRRGAVRRRRGQRVADAAKSLAATLRGAVPTPEEHVNAAEIAQLLMQQADAELEILAGANSNEHSAPATPAQRQARRRVRQRLERDLAAIGYDRPTR